MNLRLLMRCRFGKLLDLGAVDPGCCLTIASTNWSGDSGLIFVGVSSGMNPRTSLEDCSSPTLNATRESIIIRRPGFGQSALPAHRRGWVVVQNSSCPQIFRWSVGSTPSFDKFLLCNAP